MGMAAKKNITDCNIARIREHKGLTIEQLAFGLPADLFMGPKELHEIERGLHTVYDKNLLEIARVLCVSVSELFSTSRPRINHQK